MSKQNKTLQFVFVVVIGFLILLSVLTYQRLNALITLGQLVNQTTQLTLELEKTVGLLKDAETGYRDYLLTQEKKFLDPFNSSVIEYPIHLQKIKELIPNHSKQQNELLVIENLISNHQSGRLQKLGNPSQLTPSEDELISSKMTMDSLLYLVDNLIKGENSLMAERSLQLQKHSSLAPALILLLSFLALLILIVSYWQLNKSNSQTQFLQDAIVKQNVQLEKKKELQNVFKQAPVPIAVFRKSDFFVEVINDVALQLLGKSLEEVIDKPLFEIAPNLKELIQPLFQQVLESGEPFFANEFPIQFDHQGQLYNGFFDLVIQPALDEKGNRSGLIAIGQEVTESVLARKQIELSEERYKELSLSLEEKVIVRTSELKKEKDFSDAIIDTSLDLIVVYDLDMRIIVFNKSCEDFFKIQREVILGKTFVEAFPLGKDTPGHQDLIHALQGHTIHNNVYLSPITGRYYENFITPLKDSQENVYAALVIAHDIHDTVASSEKINKVNIELEKKNKELESFAYISSHDLQEPLRKIQTFATRILEKEHQTLSDNAKDNFKRMQIAAHRMQRLIEDLLAYSRTSTEIQKMERIDLRDLLEEVKEDLKEDLKNKQAIIDFKDSVVTDVIPFQFRQMMHNLIGNSLKFSKPDIPPYIVIEAEIKQGKTFADTNLKPDQNYCHIRISDNGIGFDSKYNKKIFELFQRLHDKDSYHGTGIGLAIVKKIIDNHNGLITAAGIPNQGASFDIYLPHQLNE